MRAQQSHLVLACLASLCFLPVLVGCGDEEEPDPNAIICHEEQPVRAVGTVGGDAVNYTRSLNDGNLATGELVGERTARRFVVELGDVLIDPEDPSSESAPLIVSFQTNASAPEGGSLAEDINLLLQGGTDTLEIVDLPLDQYCDITQGKICARFGRDDTGDRELTNEGTLVHAARSGTLTIKNWTSTRADIMWDLEIGPSVEGAREGGVLKGCTSVAVGLTQSGSEPLRVLVP